MDTAPSGHRLGFALGITALLVPAGVVLYAFFIEPYSIELTRHALAADVLQPLKIAHLTDLHTRGFGTRERQVVELVNQAAPDLIVVTGDIVDGGSLEPSREIFGRLRAPLGVWVVRGNAEQSRPEADNLVFFRSVNAHLLDNQGVAVRGDVWLVGLDDPLTGHPNLRVALEKAPASLLQGGPVHSPDRFAEVAGLFNLGLAGTPTAGRCASPGLGSWWLPPDAHATCRAGTPRTAPSCTSAAASGPPSYRPASWPGPRWRSIESSRIRSGASLRAADLSGGCVSVAGAACRQTHMRHTLLRRGSRRGGGGGAGVLGHQATQARHGGLDVLLGRRAELLVGALDRPGSSPAGRAGR